MEENKMNPSRYRILMKKGNLYISKDKTHIVLCTSVSNYHISNTSGKMQIFTHSFRGVVVKQLKEVIIDEIAIQGIYGYYASQDPLKYEPYLKGVLLRNKEKDLRDQFLEENIGKKIILKEMTLAVKHTDLVCDYSVQTPVQAGSKFILDDYRFNDLGDEELIVTDLQEGKKHVLLYMFFNPGFIEIINEA
jgi:hypothetical protein